jgi:hypothetical protein
LNTLDKPSNAPRADLKTLKPFITVSIVWFVISGVACFQFANPGHTFSAFRWMAELWALCLIDLYALAKAVGAALSLVSATGEKRGALIIQASYWGMIKLACLGILGAILLRGSTIPTTGLLMGSATLVVIPLIGGYWWSQKVLRHAS